MDEDLLNKAVMTEEGTDEIRKVTGESDQYRADTQNGFFNQHEHDAQRVEQDSDRKKTAFDKGKKVIQQASVTLIR